MHKHIKITATAATKQKAMTSWPSAGEGKCIIVPTEMPFSSIYASNSLNAASILHIYPQLLNIT
jgi:hypothetical protein